MGLMAEPPISGYLPGAIPSLLRNEGHLDSRQCEVRVDFP